MPCRAINPKDPKSSVKIKAAKYISFILRSSKARCAQKVEHQQAGHRKPSSKIDNT